MISLRDAATLAFTKLRTRKVRTFFTIFVAGILFSGIFVMVLVTQGFFQSADRFMNESMAGRYIISAQDTSMFTSGGSDQSTNPELVAQAKTEYSALIASKKAEAKRLGIEYDPSVERSPIMDNPDKKGEKMLDYGNPIAQKLMNDYTKAHSSVQTIETLRSVAEPYHAKVLYQTQAVAPSSGSLVEMQQGKEKFDSSVAQQNTYAPMGGGPDDTRDAAMVPSALMKLYLLPNASWQASSGHVPVIVSQKRASTLLNFPAPKSDAPAKQRLEYAQELKKRANGLTFDMCYRNQASQDRIMQAITVAKEIDTNKANRDYVKPSLIYGLPDQTSCGAATVVADTRTADEKSYQAKLDEFRRTFGESVDPVERKVTYEVVGISPNGYMDGGMSSGISDLLMMMLTSQSFRFAIPTEMYNQLSTKEELKDIFSPYNGQYSATPQLYAEFDNASDAKRFMQNETCSFSMNGTCQPATKKFMLTPYGSNSLALDDARQTMTHVTVVITLITMAIAGLIAGLTIGRTIADGRRETAVFRAIGFKRLDIAQIYTTYTLLLSVGVIVVSLGIGLTLAAVVDHLNWVNATTAAQLALGVTDTHQEFRFLMGSPQLLWVMAAIMGASLLGMMLPLVRNVRRSPIRDMRDE